MNTIPAVPVTALYAALCALLVLALAARVIVLRWSTKTGIGDGGDRRLARAIRVHGNATEYVPIALLLLLVAELSGADRALLHGCGGALVAARVAHAIGLERSAGTSVGRFLGTTVTFGVIAVLAVAGVVAFLR
jgi:uncharacterized membrane protein YecN with MAPEG domain